MKVAARVRLTLLGGFQAQVDGGAALILPTRKTQALLAYLALPLGQSHPREKLAGLLWGDMADAQARGNLRHALSRIRKALPRPVRAGMILDGPSVVLDPAVVDVDVTQFERLVADGRPPALERIPGLYRGELLAGLALAERPFEEWLTSERERLHELAIQGLGHLLIHQQQAGAAETAVQTGLRLLALDPLQEPVYRAVMRLYARLGRREAALRQYQLCVDALKRELRAQPEAETTQLREQILRSRAVRPDAAEAPPSTSGDRPRGPIAELLAAAATSLPEAPPPTNLPAPTSELIGRDAALTEVTELLGVHRLVTLIGAGGIGKTRLGLEVARQHLPDHPDGVWVAELAPLSDPGLVPVTVAVALGLAIPGAESPERVAAALGTKRVLLVLDNCEHVIEAAARMAEAVLRANPFARVMATSREPLRAPGEYVYRVLPLQVPAEGSDEHEELLDTAAVKLFLARAQAMDRRFFLDARSAPIAGAVCRRLDGIPLAIELAAARTATLGVAGLAARLDDRFRLLTGGHRTALPRHQTLRATLDWSHELLPPIERRVLHRLAVFAGGFTLEAASAVAASASLGALEVVDSITNLAAKSLVVVEGTGTGAVTRYRLLETMRAYALDKLTESGELDQVARRHSEYYRDLFERAETEWEARSTVEWLAAYAREIDNTRIGLDWAFSPRGDTGIGVALTAAAVPLWFQQSLMVECRGRAERALASLGPRPGRDARREMQLCAALGVSLMQTKGPAPDTIAAWTTALEIADRLVDTEYQLRALWGLWHFRVSRGECRASLELAERFSERVAHADPADRPVGERMIGASLHYLGDQPNARRHLEAMLGRYVHSARRSHTIRFQYDQPLVARMILARILWLQGFPDQGLRLAHENVEDAKAIGHALSVCGALEVACLVAIWSGVLAAAERSVAMLLDHSARHALAAWHARGRCLHGVLLIRRGDVRDGFELLRAALDELRETGFVPHHTALLGTLAQGFAGGGEISQGLATIDEALTRSERDEEHWCIADLLRIKAELVLLAGGPAAAAAAEELFQQALHWTRRQGILSMELRCATGLARLWHQQGRPGPARELLAPVYGRFTEGFDTPELQAAKTLLARLG